MKGRHIPLIFIGAWLIFMAVAIVGCNDDDHTIIVPPSEPEVEECDPVLCCEDPDHNPECCVQYTCTDPMIPIPDDEEDDEDDEGVQT